MTLQQLTAFNSHFKLFTAASIHEQIDVPPGSAGVVQFTFGGGLNYVSPQTGQMTKLAPGPNYQVIFSVSEVRSADNLARVYGQQRNWDPECWPCSRFTLGQAIDPDVQKFVNFKGEAWPCTEMTCTTKGPSRKIEITAQHFKATVDMSKMMNQTPGDDEELIAFIMVTEPKASGVIVISKI